MKNEFDKNEKSSKNRHSRKGKKKTKLFFKVSLNVEHKNISNECEIKFYFMLSLIPVEGFVRK